MRLLKRSEVPYEFFNKCNFNPFLLYIIALGIKILLLSPFYVFPSFIIPIVIFVNNTFVSDMIGHHTNRWATICLKYLLFMSECLYVCMAKSFQEHAEFQTIINRQMRFEKKKQDQKMCCRKN